MLTDINFSTIRLVCSDIDGTLVRGEKVLPEELKNEIWKLRKKGIYFTFSTGRLPYEIGGLWEGIPNDLPYIAGNGTVIKKREETLWEKCFCPRALRPIAEKYSKLGVTIIFTLDDLERPLQVTPWASAHAKIFPGLDWPVDEGIWDKQLHRMYFYHPDGEYLSDCRKDLEPFEDRYSICYQNRASIQIGAFGCTKGSGVKKLAEFLDLKKENIMCFGDEDNDLSMIEYARVGVAVGNAADSLKSAADYTTTEPYYYGVLEVLKECNRQQDVVKG